MRENPALDGMSKDIMLEENYLQIAEHAGKLIAVLQLLAACLQVVKVISAGLHVTTVVGHAVCKGLGLTVARLIRLGNLDGCLLSLCGLRIS